MYFDYLHSIIKILQEAYMAYKHPSRTKTIALHLPGAIGDIIMTLNLIPELQKKYPEHTIDYFCNPYIGQGLKYLMVSAGINKILENTAYRDSIKNYAHAFNLVGYPFKEGYPNKPMGDHLIRYYAKDMGLDVDGIPALTLPTPPNPVKDSIPYATLQVKTGWSNYKEWEMSKWETIVKQCDFPVIQIGAADHPKIAGAIHDYMGTSLFTAISLLANAKIHLGVDSFANHLTHYNWLQNNQTRKVPAVILWGSSQYSAAGYQHNVNISAGLPCQPCFKQDPKLFKNDNRGPCDNPPNQIYSEPHHKCMGDITVDMVMPHVKDIWKKTPNNIVAATKPSIGLVMIVKNEEHVLPELFESIWQMIDYWVITDTGSTDNTCNLISSFFAEKGVPGELHHVPWKNFGYNRTMALRFAEGKTDYMWVIDADDKVQGNIDFSKLTLDVYSLRYGQNFVYWRKQLFRSGLAWKYLGVLHEYAESGFDKTHEFLAGDYYVESRRLGARNKDPQKYNKDAAVFEQALVDEPNNTRYWFYLAQSYYDAGNFAKARDAYKQRASMGGWQEEVFYAWLRIGLCENQLGNKNDAIVAFLEAYNAQPTRAESLYHLAFQYRLEKKYELAFFFAQRAAQIPKPQPSALFVYTDIYDYKILDELSVSAFYTTHAPYGFAVCQELLTKTIPDDVRARVLDNIEHYKKKLKIS